MKRLFTVLAFVTLSQTANATPDAMPNDLLYSGKPIDSLCFYDYERKDSMVDLTRCGAAVNHYRTRKGYDELLNKGFLGYEWQDAKEKSDIYGSTYYQYFAAEDGKYWIYTVNSGGGSGNFTALYLAKRTDKDHLKLETIASGDRCNGGLGYVTEKNKTISFSVSLTAYDVIKLAQVQTPGVQAYDDLAACAACCFADANYTVQGNSAPILTSVTLDTTTDASELSDQGKYQVCFNELFKSYRDQKQTELNPTMLDEFTGQFKQKCLNK